MDIYLSPNFVVDDDFNINNDCNFNGVASSAICTTTKSPSFLKIQIKSTNPSVLNPLPKQTVTWINIKNIFPSRSTSNKFIYPCYFTLYKNDAPGSPEYYDTHIITVMPKYGGLTNVRM